MATTDGKTSTSGAPRPNKTEVRRARRSWPATYKLEILAPLAELPQLGPELPNRWEGMRFLLGPWRWMILVYAHDDVADRVVVVTIQDARSSRAATLR